LTAVTSTIWPCTRVPFQPMPPSHQVQVPLLVVMET
jgi:hypothetical protein